MLPWISRKPIIAILLLLLPVSSASRVDEGDALLSLLRVVPPLQPLVAGARVRRLRADALAGELGVVAAERDKSVRV